MRVKKTKTQLSLKRVHDRKNVKISKVKRLQGLGLLRELGQLNQANFTAEESSKAQGDTREDVTENKSQGVAVDLQLS